MKYTQIVFDIDGTLIDTEYAVLHSLQDTVLYLTGEKIPAEKLAFALGITGDDALKRLGIKDISAASNLWDSRMRHYADTVTVFDGMEALLAALAQTSFETGIITSETKEELKRDFLPFGIGHYFHTIVCADDTDAHKPSPAPLLKYMERSGAAPGQILYIGDSEYDSRCARSAGADFALAVWGSHRRTIRADYYPEKPGDLLPIIQQDSTSKDFQTRSAPR